MNFSAKYLYNFPNAKPFEIHICNVHCNKFKYLGSIFHSNVRNDSNFVILLIDMFVVVALQSFTDVFSQ